MPVTRKRKIEVARLAGFGLVLAGLFALFLAVMSAQNAGAVKAAPRNAVLHCHTWSDDGIGGAVQYGACGTTTSLGQQGSTTTWKHQCGCSTTTTTIAVSPESSTSTTTHVCRCSTSTTSTSTTSTSTSTSTTTSSTTTSSTTPTSDTLPASSSSSSSTTGPEKIEGGPVTTFGTPGHGSTGNQGTQGAEAANAQQLPFTGSSSFPLAGFGLLLVVTGLALSLRRRRLVG